MKATASGPTSFGVGDSRTDRYWKCVIRMCEDKRLLLRQVIGPSSFAHKLNLSVEAEESVFLHRLFRLLVFVLEIDGD